MRVEPRRYSDRLRLGRAVQVAPFKTTLRAPGTKRLNLKCDEPLSNVAFKFNLRRYSSADETVRVWLAPGGAAEQSARDLAAANARTKVANTRARRLEAGAYTRPLSGST